MALGRFTWIAALATAVVLLSEPYPALAQTTGPGTPSALPDLSLRLTASPDPVNSGEVLTYNVTVRNQGGMRPPAVARLQITIPSGTTFVAAVAPCAREGTVVACQVQPLDPLGTATFGFAVLVTATSGQVFSLATLDDELLVNDSDRSNNIASLLTTVRLATPTPSATVFPPFFPTRTPTITTTPTPTPSRTPGMSGGPELPPRPPSGPAPGSAPAPAVVGPPASIEQPPAAVESPASVGPATAAEPPAPSSPPLISVPEPALAPPIDPQVWLIILSPTTAYSISMDLLWTAAPGERYLVALEESGWALALWEGEVVTGLVNGWVWIGLDSAVERQLVDRAAPM